MLTNIIPDAWRQRVYAVYALVATAEGAMLTAYSTIHAATPSWLLIAMAVTVYLAIPIGATAASNVPTPAPAPVPVVVAPVVPDPIVATPTPTATDQPAAEVVPAP